MRWRRKSIPPLPASNRFRPPPRLIAGAGLFAAAELAAGLLLGGLIAWGRAEALLFLAFRPWLLLAAAAAVSGWRLSERAGFYALALALAALSESVLLLGLGALSPWSEAARGVAAGGLLALAFDLVLQLGRRVNPRWGRSAATVLLLATLLVPGVLDSYRRIAVDAGTAAVGGERPRLLLMTQLPIIWGEAGPFDPASRPAESYRLLQREYELRPLDVLDAEGLGGGRLLLLAQPRALAPEELVALDDWVRRGGRVLILADPRLAWPSGLPLGDIRRPPAASQLAPLLRHWGLRLERGEAGLLVLRSGDRRLALGAPGRFAATGTDCRTIAEGLAARCRIGRGRALLLADADLLRDELWLPPGGSADRAAFRTADNPLALADWLDRLGGIERPRSAAPVAWTDPDAPRAAAVALAAVPPALAAGLGLLLGLRRRRHSRST